MTHNESAKFVAIAATASLQSIRSVHSSTHQRRDEAIFSMLAHVLETMN